MNYTKETKELIKYIKTIPGTLKHEKMLITKKILNGRKYYMITM